MVPKPQPTSREPDTEPCEHCECLAKGYRCCSCGITLDEIEPVVVDEREVTINPVAMEYETAYPFIHMGLHWEAIRHRNEAVEIRRAELCNEVETVVADCRETGGWLSEDVECGIDSEPWCFYHEKKWRAENDPYYVPELGKE